MGTKRASTEGESSEFVKAAKKQKKERHEKKRENAAKQSKLPVQFQLVQLQKLVQGLSADFETIKDVIGEKTGGVDVANAIEALGAAFDSSASSGNRDCLQLPSTPYYSLPTPSVTENPIRSTKQRPPTDGSLPCLPVIKNESLKLAVFTHTGIDEQPSFTSSTTTTETSYDRLEILGDAYIEVIATKLIWEQFRTLPAGRISQIRELLVKNETLAEYTSAYGLDKSVRVPKNILKFPKRWIKIKGDVLEAYVAAVILSDPVHGLQTAENWLTQLWLPKLATVQLPRNSIKAEETPHEQNQRRNLPYKEQLQQMVVSKGVKLKYIDEKPMIKIGGLITFYIGVYISGWGFERKHLGSGTGMNKSEAGGEAAKQALENKPLIDEIRAMKVAFDEKAKTKRDEASPS